MNRNAETHGLNSEIRVVESIDEIEKLRPIWEGMQKHFNSDIDMFLMNLGARQCILQPYVLLLLLDGRPLAILAGRIEEVRFKLKIGFKTINGPMTRQLVIIYHGLIGDASQSTSELFIAELMRAFAKKHIDAVWFYSLQVDSELYRAAQIIPSFFGRDHGAEIGYHWSAKLPSSGVDEFLKKISSKHRYWLRRLPKVLEKDHPGRIEYKIFTASSDVARLCEDCEEVASKTYHRALAVGFTDDEPGRRRLMLWAEKQALRGYVLYIDGKPNAFWIGTRYASSFHLDYTGYHPDFKKYELGTILFMKMVEDLICNGVDELDFGLGTLWYKERFGEKSKPEGSIYIFAPSIKGVLINVIRMSVNMFAENAKWLLKRAGIFAKVKNRLRNKLTATP
jgi:hypothetical protein